MIVAAVRECCRLETNWKLIGNRPNQRQKWKLSVNFLETYSKPRGPSADAKPRGRGGRENASGGRLFPRERQVIAREADSYALASLPRVGSRGRTRIFTSTREPRRFKIDINRSAVNLP